MPSFPRRIISNFHAPFKLFDCLYSNEKLVQPALPVATRTEVSLSTEFGYCPGRGVVKRILVEEISGGTFNFDLVDKPFETASPDAANIVYRETGVVGLADRSVLLEIPYELKINPDFPYPNLYMGLTPTAGTGKFRVHVYVESRH